MHLRQPKRTLDERVSEWRQQVQNELGGDKPTISALVLDELLYRLILAWLADDGHPDPLTGYRHSPAEVTRSMNSRVRPVWNALDRLQLELALTDQAVVERARQLLVNPGLAPRDALHAAHALESGCEVIASSDPDFDRVTGLRRLGTSRSIPAH